MFLGLAALASAPLAAAPLTVRVVDAAGKPVRNAVVTLRPAGVAARPMRAAGAYSVSQKDLQFHPFVLVVPVGATVSFPNLDPTKHHVYSFSPAKRMLGSLTSARAIATRCRWPPDSSFGLCSMRSARPTRLSACAALWRRSRDAIPA